MIDWGTPYVTRADPGYFVCAECEQEIDTFEFIQRPIASKRGDRTARHYDCDDPHARVLHEIAKKDALDAQLGRGSKSAMESQSFRRHRRRK